MIRLLALLIFIPLTAHGALWDDSVKSYLGQLAVKSVNGNVPRGLNPDPHFLTIDPPDWYDAEQAAVSGFSWSSNPGRNAVGGAFRGYSNGSPWAFGIATEAIASPTSTAHLIGAEFDVVSRNPNSNSQRWGLNVILFNRVTGAAGEVESGLGQNRYNLNAKALVIESLPRSPIGEYSGWQTILYAGATAMDRTTERPYAAVIDVSDTTSQGAPWYLVVYRCGPQRCGLKATATGLEVWADIDGAPHLLRTL